MRLAFIAAEKAVHSVALLCRCLRVTRSGFYAWTTRGLSARAQRDLVLRTKLRAFHVASGHRYGRPNLWKDLQEDGEAVSEKRVARKREEAERFPSYGDAKMALFDYIEVFYNQRRRHSTLGPISPVRFEPEAAA
jgi:transposase InsO family protein